MQTSVELAGPREWRGLALLVLPCLVYSMDVTMLDLALPRLAAELQPTGAQLLWIVDVYGFVLASLLIPMSTLGDRIGRRRLLAIGMMAFGGASGLASFAHSAPTLIVARALLGAAGATLAPSTLSLVRNMFRDPRQRTTAVGVWTTAYATGAGVGPLVSGALLEHFRWGSIFLIPIPVTALFVMLCRRLLPEFRDSGTRGSDVPSIALSLAAILPTMYGIKQIASEGSVAWSIVAIACGLIAGLAFIRRQRVIDDPVIELDLFRSPIFATALAAYALATFVNFGMYLFVGQHFQLVLGLSPLAAGVATLPVFLAFVAGSITAPIIARRVHPVRMITLGFLVSGVGFAALATSDAHTALGAIVASATLYALGLSPVFVLSIDTIVGAVSPERAGAASAMSEAGSELGGAMGIAILGSIGTATFRRTMQLATPADIMPVVSGATRNTLSGAFAMAGALPAGVGEQFRSFARAAFSTSLNEVAWACLAVVIAAAIGVSVAARRSVTMS